MATGAWPLAHRFNHAVGELLNYDIHNECWIAKFQSKWRTPKYVDVDLIAQEKAKQEAMKQQRIEEEGLNLGETLELRKQQAKLAKRKAEGKEIKRGDSKEFDVPDAAKVGNHRTQRDFTQTVPELEPTIRLVQEFSDSDNEAEYFTEKVRIPTHCLIPLSRPLMSGDRVQLQSMGNVVIDFDGDGSVD